MGFAVSPLVRTSRKTLTFTGATNLGEAGSAATVFTVTGEIMVVAIVPYCTTLLAGASATVSLGVTSAVELFVAATTSTDIDANEFWVDTAPDANGVALPAALKDVVITDDIIVDCLVQDTASGVIEFTLLWTPVSEDAAVA